jgi:hypothetical protein
MKTESRSCGRGLTTRRITGAVAWILIAASAIAGRAPFALGQQAEPKLAPAAGPTADASAANGPAASAAPAPPRTAEELAADQRRVAEKFRRFEQVIKLLAQFSDEGDEDQVRLLRQVYAEAQSRSIDGKFDELVKLLQTNQLGLAVDNQKALGGQLDELLKMMLSAERGKELKEEQARIKDYIKRIKELITKQLEVQGRTTEGDPKSLAPAQGKLAGDANDLADRMAQGSKPKDGAQGAKPGDAKPGEGKPGEAKPGDPKPGEAKPGEGKPGEGKPGEGKPSEGKSSEGQPGEGQQGEQAQSPSGEQSRTDSPQRRVAAARKKMEDAQKKLDKAEREGAIKDQENALRELEQAKAELEEILRQLREEELARLIEMLEKRFAQMLAMQEAVYRDTQGLHAVPAASRGQGEKIEAGRLSRDEDLIRIEADKALNLLKEEGSAVAFPKTVEAMRDDMSQIAELLSAVEVDELTLAMEEDVIATLKELLEALKKAKKDLKDKKQQKGQSGEAGENPLVDKIAELKMIRSLQLRVNRRTKLIAETADVATNPKSLEMLRKLAATEQEVFQITRDIVLGKNE